MGRQDKERWPGIDVNRRMSTNGRVDLDPGDLWLITRAAEAEGLGCTVKCPSNT